MRAVERASSRRVLIIVGAVVLPPLISVLIYRCHRAVREASKIRVEQTGAINHFDTLHDVTHEQTDVIAVAYTALCRSVQLFLYDSFLFCKSYADHDKVRKHSESYINVHAKTLIRHLDRQ